MNRSKRAGFAATACAAALMLALSACTAGPGATARPTHPVEAVGKVVASLKSETERRAGDEGYRGLPLVVNPAGAGGVGVERIVAELLRTQLLDAGMTVRTACGTRCLEVTLQEFSTSGPSGWQLTPGQILTVAAGGVPIVGNLARSLNDQERAAAHTTGLLVTYAARDGERYTARSHVIAIISSSSGDVALERK
ncbi:MAG TPA: hypothetical protein VFV84_16365 [Burkholderiales bacterium]|nr:hypothetical protein [Burkholderiales bacterium]